MVEAKVTLVQDMQFTGTAESGHSLSMDADEISGGKNSGFRPMELLLVGFGGCSGMDVISILRKNARLCPASKSMSKAKRPTPIPKYIQPCM